MPIPPQRQIYNPILQMAVENEKFTFSMAFAWLEEHFGVTDEEREERVPSGARRFESRVRWAIGNLKRAGLLMKAGREFRITDEGRRVHERGDTISEDSLRELRQRRETREQAEDSTESELITQASEAEDVENPHEGILRAHAEINAALSADLLDGILGRNSEFFESLVIDLLCAIYGVDEDAGQVLGRSGDGGVDGVVNRDPLGMDLIYVQAKRYSSDHSVGPEAINSFSGALNRRRSSKGIFFTTSSFTSGAVRAAKEVGISLVDGRKLAQLMIRYNIGCRVEDTLEIKKVDEDFFSDD